MGEPNLKKQLLLPSRGLNPPVRPLRTCRKKIKKVVILFTVYSSNTALMMPSWPGRLMIRARPISVLTMAPLVSRFRDIVRVCAVLFNVLDLNFFGLAVGEICHVRIMRTHRPDLGVPARDTDDLCPVFPEMGVCGCKPDLKSPLSRTGRHCRRLPSVLILPARAWCHSFNIFFGKIPFRKMVLYIFLSELFILFPDQDDFSFMRGWPREAGPYSRRSSCWS